MLLVYLAYDDIPEDAFHIADMIYPESGKLLTLPMTVADIYSEAFRIKRLAPNLCSTDS
jgi:hypothetical protein